MNTILQLTDGQKKIYDLLYMEMSKGNYRIRISSAFPKESVSLIVKLVLGDHPWLINFDNCNISLENRGVYNLLTLKPIFNPCDLQEAINCFEQETKKIIKSIIKPNTNQIQKVLAIHDYIVNNVSYDESELYNINSTATSHTAYGAIVQKKAVCEGISYAFVHLANKVGVNATVVNGKADRANHAWNMIKFASEYYHIDATWDIRQRDNSTAKVYDYFCLRDLDLKSRSWDKKIYPGCISSKCNYFNVTDSFAHDKQQLRRIILRQLLNSKSMYLKYDFLNMSKDEIVDYIWNETADVANSNGINLQKVTITLNDDQNIFTLFSN